MATQEIVTLNDDLDSRISTGVETVTFFDPSTGQKREIELGEANRKHFANHLEKLAKYIAVSREVELPKPVVVKATATKGSSEASKIREWAIAQGMAVGDRGRIKAEIKDAYYAAQAGTTIPEIKAALENSAKGNVTDLGDFTQYADDVTVDTVIDEVDSRQDEAEASMDAYDAQNGTHVVDSDAPEVVSSDDKPATEADILDMLNDMDNENKTSH